MRQDGVDGSVDDVDFDEIRLDALEEAIRDGESTGPIPSVAFLVATSKTVLRIRSLVMQRNWSAVAEIVPIDADACASMVRSDSLVSMHSVFFAEFLMPLSDAAAINDKK